MPRLAIIYQTEYFHLSSAKIVIELNSFLESEFASSWPALWGVIDYDFEHVVHLFTYLYPYSHKYIHSCPLATVQNRLFTELKFQERSRTTTKKAL